jgi:hypothetical protein
MVKNKKKKVLIFGGGGRVGLNLIAELLRYNFDIIVVDFLDKSILSKRVLRVLSDATLTVEEMTSTVQIYSNFDILEKSSVLAILIKEAPDLVMNYAIPLTWDATKKLKNYNEISKAGLGIFAAVQALAPKIISEAIYKSGIKTKYLVGNLPDITIPILYGIANQNSLKLPLAGAGNVGLIQIAIRNHVANLKKISINDVIVFLVAHHIHWVAPREPGYKNDAPFLLQVIVNNKDITQELGEPRKLMNEAIINCYEPGAEFSVTTAMLAARTIIALLNNSDIQYPLHLPSPNGLVGGYPVLIKKGTIHLNLPKEWNMDQAIALMHQAQQRDGIDKIASDGTIHFKQESVDILHEELGFSLPIIVPVDDLESVAIAQIKAVKGLLI